MQPHHSTQGDVVAGYIDALGCRDDFPKLHARRGPLGNRATISIERYPHRKKVPCPLFRHVSLSVLLYVFKFLFLFLKACCFQRQRITILGSTSSGDFHDFVWRSNGHGLFLLRPSGTLRVLVRCLDHRQQWFLSFEDVRFGQLILQLASGVVYWEHLFDTGLQIHRLTRCHGKVFCGYSGLPLHSVGLFFLDRNLFLELWYRYFI